jgi:hypothetical protein
VSLISFRTSLHDARMISWCGPGLLSWWDDLSSPSHILFMRGRSLRRRLPSSSQESCYSYWEVCLVGLEDFCALV